MKIYRKKVIEKSANLIEIKKKQKSTDKNFKKTLTFYNKKDLFVLREIISKIR